MDKASNVARTLSLRLVSMLCVALLWTMAPVLAQTGTALTGTVLDQTGAVLPGVQVTVSAASVARTATTDWDGNFRLSVSPGKYDIRVELPGFKTIEQTGVDVPSTGSSLSFTMEIARFDELTVVSASKVETELVNAPATASVITSNTIASASASHYGDLLRAVPGVNVIQLSARDINLTSRQGTSTLATSQLTLLDGRSIYQDFFGFVLWDFLPTNLSEIKQIEVIRGPASAVWGANAQTGVVNIISKSPREMLGTSVTFSAGAFDRDVKGGPDKDPGFLFGVNATHAQQISDRFAFKVSAGYFQQESMARPVGIIPRDPERGTGGTPYPPFRNQGTRQPKFDFRLDQELSNGGRLTYAAGVAASDGIIHTGIGPFDIHRGTYLGYGKVNYSRGNLKLNFFTNFLDGDAQALLSRGPDGLPINFIFESQTYDVEAGHAVLLGEKQILSFGGNYRRNNFDLSIAPLGSNRNEVGGYIQDDIFIDKFRFVLGARIDKFDVIDDPIFSPRLTVMFKPTSDHTFRVSYNRAFRSPSFINNFLDLSIIAVDLDLGLFSPALRGRQFPIIARTVGNEDLEEDKLTAVEIGYTGTVGRSLFGVSFYVNDSDNSINFTNPPGAVYSSRNPPPGWPLPPQVFDLLAAQGIFFPSRFTYLNLGPVRDKGIETSFDHALNNWASLFVNYSWQDDTVIKKDPNPFPKGELAFPPTHRFNAGANFNHRRFLGNFSVNYTSDAFWTDVLDSRFHGPTDDYTLVNAGFGVKWMRGKVITSVKVNNLTNDEIQQHVFGDILKRSIVAELKFNFLK